jgi:hypothetical protein
MAFAWMVVKQASTGVYGMAQTGHFALPGVWAVDKCKSLCRYVNVRVF